MNYLVFVFVIIVLSSIIYLLNSEERRVEIIDRAFAGAPKGSDTVIEMSTESNKTIYVENGREIDLSKMRKFYIDGKSLRKAGLDDGTVVYTEMLSDEDSLLLLVDSFIILKMDKDRMKAEYPEKPEPINGFKARKAVAVLPTKMDMAVFGSKMSEILKGDTEIAENEWESCLERLKTKYQFASDYYKDDKEIIVSITYKGDDETKDYSFHSPSWLAGVVRYKNID